MHGETVELGETTFRPLSDTDHVTHITYLLHCVWC